MSDSNAKTIETFAPIWALLASCTLRLASSPCANHPFSFAPRYCCTGLALPFLYAYAPGIGKGVLSFLFRVQGVSFSGHLFFSPQLFH